jgi:hypothetical protein
MFWCFFDLKNVFATVKILTISRGELKYVQMDQSLIHWDIAKQAEIFQLFVS